MSKAGMGTMRLSRTQTRSDNTEPPVSYDRLSMVQLVNRVGHCSDRRALAALLTSRNVFRLPRHGPVSFDAFIASMQEVAWARRWVSDAMALDRAGDLVRDRFSFLVEPSHQREGERRRGPDCRRYFRAFLKSWETWLSDHPDLSPLEREMHAARLFQRFVLRHFRLACREAGRTSNPTRSRYAWRVGGRVIHLWLPKRLAPTDRRRWLENHIEDVDPHRSGEWERVQAIVDAHFGVARVVSIDDVPADVPDETARWSPSDQGAQPGQLVFDLPRYVAREKAETIDQQRPAVRDLGAEALEALVLEIFRGIDEGGYNQADLALRFGISESTLTRFAAKNWRNTEGIPDLFINTAQVLAGHPPFVEAAKDAGVWQDVEAVLRKSHRARTRRHRDDG